MTTKNTLSRKHFLQGAALVSAGSLLAACGQPAAPTAAPTGAEKSTEAPKPTAVPTKQEPIELKYSTADREVENKVKAYDVENFNAAMESSGKPYRIIDVKGPATDNDEHTKFTLDAAAGTLPDIFGTHGAWVADFAAAGYLADLGPYLTKWDGWSQIYDVLKPLATFEGKLVGVPSGGSFSFYYRKDVLQNAGISLDQPKVWDDFYKVCDQIKTKTDSKVKPCGIPAATPWGGGTWGEGFIMVWLSFDGTIFDEADGKWVVSSPNLLNAFKVYETLAKNGWLTVDELLGTNPWEPIKYQEFPKGECAIVTGGDWQWTFDWGPEGATPIEGLFEKVERWAFPAENGKPFTFIDGTAGTVVAANSKSIEGCVEFLEFINDPKHGCGSIEIHIGGPSNRRDFADKCPAYKEIVNGKMYQASQFFETGRTYKFMRSGAEKLSEGVGRATEDIITLDATAEEAMEKFANDMIEALGADKAKKA